MGNEIKPIKRSEALAPFSREHHEGLLFVWKIRQGIKHKIDDKRILNYCQWFWQNHLKDHFKKEEEFLPVVLLPQHQLIKQMLEEHKEIFHQLQALNEADDKYMALEKLATAINDHIRFEERKLFNEIEKAATPEQLQSLTEKLNIEKSVEVWQDEFWMIRN